MKTFKNWMQDQFETDTLKDIANHGCVAGFGGLTYYNETCALYAEFKDEIWELADNLADEMGEKNVLSLIASFGGADNVCNAQTFENLMVWFAAEHYARLLTEDNDDQE